MNSDKKYWMLKAMRTCGGSFVQNLSLAWQVADRENRKRLEIAFPEYVEAYTKLGDKLQKEEKEKEKENDHAER